MIDLKDLTIAIPVKIESTDRYNNLKTVLGYINHHFKTNIKIIEESNGDSKIDFLDSFRNLSIDYKHYIVPDGNAYHRTKYLNEMIYSTNTKVISNYDSDVFFPIETYIKAVNSILNNESDFVYPYTYGDSQKKLFYSKWYEDPFRQWVYYRMFNFIQDWDINQFDEDENVKTSVSSYGHSIFANTEKYKEAFGENECFISYGPEDQERAYRFKKLGYNINWIDGFVYHIEHTRTADSNRENKYFEKNEQLFEFIKSLSKDELIKYYKNLEYIKKYK